MRVYLLIFVALLAAQAHAAKQKAELANEEDPEDKPLVLACNQTTKCKASASEAAARCCRRRRRRLCSDAARCNPLLATRPLPPSPPPTASARSPAARFG